jgi:hypothetical protein
MTSTKGKTHGAKRVAKANAAKESAKSNSHPKSASRVRKSTQTVRKGTDRPVRVQSKPVQHNNDNDALFRAKAEALAAKAAKQDALRELREANKLTAGQWIAVTIFLLAFIGAGVLIGRAA